MPQRLGRLLAAALLTLGCTVVTVVASASPALADGCYTWGGTLAQGASGEAVRQLQIRVAGYPGSGAVLTIDGAFGPATKAAVQRFQAAYGLTADGIAGPATFTRLYALQDDDCTPVNFSYAELNTCNSTWAGGNVSAATARANALVTMWKLQALRHALGDQPIRVTSGFRSAACNNAVGARRPAGTCTATRPTSALARTACAGSPRRPATTASPASSAPATPTTTTTRTSTAARAASGPPRPAAWRV